MFDKFMRSLRGKSNPPLRLARRLLLERLEDRTLLDAGTGTTTGVAPLNIPNAASPANVSTSFSGLPQDGSQVGNNPTPLAGTTPMTAPAVAPATPPDASPDPTAPLVTATTPAVTPALPGVSQSTANLDAAFATLAPVIASIPDQNSSAGDNVSPQVSATVIGGGDIAYSAAGLPPGLVMNPTGLISSTVTSGTTAGYAVLVTATSGTMSSQLAIAWAVVPPLGPVSDPGSSGGTLAASQPQGDDAQLAGDPMPAAGAVQLAAGAAPPAAAANAANAAAPIVQPTANPVYIPGYGYGVILFPPDVPVTAGDLNARLTSLFGPRPIGAFAGAGGQRGVNVVYIPGSGYVVFLVPSNRPTTVSAGNSGPVVAAGTSTRPSFYYDPPYTSGMNVTGPDLRGPYTPAKVPQILAPSGVAGVSTVGIPSISPGAGTAMTLPPPWTIPTGIDAVLAGGPIRLGPAYVGGFDGGFIPTGTKDAYLPGGWKAVGQYSPIKGFSLTMALPYIYGDLPEEPVPQVPNTP